MIYMLREAGAGEMIRIERLNVVDFSVLLQEHAFRPALVHRFKQEEHYFRAAAQIARAAGLFLFTRPLHFGAMPTVISSLEDHWCKVGVTKRAALARAPDEEDPMMIQRRGDWLSAKVGDELVMMSAERGEFVGLSEVGTRVWELIETPQELETLCNKLQE